jgi:tetratricopeptide (TPR) repeat protein
MKHTIFGLMLVALMATSAFAADPVKVSVESVVIPTYLIGPPDPNPQFYFGGASQGAQHRIYPYPVYDNLTTEKADKTYTMVYLENEYVKIGILPEIGGKIFEAVDKTNGYDFVYHQHVIKPALISLLGAWISGGVEWDVPHHHRATSFLPVQYKIEEGTDGSKTVWVGELELRDRMEWTVGLTLHPGKSYLEAKFRIINRTAVPTTMLCFSNVAVSVNDTYQVIFPPSTQHVTYHAKRDFTTWPIATGRFSGADFGAGTDVSWVKNHYNSMSMFAWNYQDDFLAGFDHGKNAGTMSIADHNVVPGKKFFTWGNGPSGRGEDTLLTDHDGPYIELMVGAYSDNQPDYTWLQPYEAREWTQYWYPFRGIDGAKNANTDAAVNLVLKDGKAQIGFYSTSDHPGARVSFTYKNQEIFGESADISPAKPYFKLVNYPVDADEHDLRASLSVDGKELVAYSPVKLQPEAMPAVVTPPAAPSEIKTNEELYLTGLRIEQFHAPGALPDPYWNEALKRDPADIRVNTAMGIDAIKAGKFAEAEKYLRTALQRATDKYTSPKDGEPYYYLGLALQSQGKNEDAFAQYFKSTWSAAWRGPGYFALAQIACGREDFDAALTYFQDSLAADARDTRALALESAIYRHKGMTAEAAAVALSIARIDPLDVDAMAEVSIAEHRPESAVFDMVVSEFPALALEAAVDYMNAGLWSDATDVLNRQVPMLKNNALALYDLAYCANRMNQPDKTAEYLRAAAQAPTDYVFPFQREMIAVLKYAMAKNPTDSHAPYYLGNLLYDWQPDRAVSLWEKSVALGADFPVVYRNLALVQTRDGQARDLARTDLEKAAELGGSAMVFNDLDKLYEEDGVSPDQRLAEIEQHEPVINRDDVISRQINLDIFAGKYDQAIELLKGRFFRSWEGGQRYSLGDSWVNAHLLKGRAALAAKNYQDALADFNEAQNIPANLQEATGNIDSRRGEISYSLGCAYDALGDVDHAKGAWQTAAAGAADQAVAFGGRGAGRGGRGGRGGGFGRGPMGGLAAGVSVNQAAPYYQALALEKLGQPDKARAIYHQLLMAATKSLGGDAGLDSPVKSGAALADRTTAADSHYLAGLGELGLNDHDKAIQQFKLALAAAPDHLAAKAAMMDAAK